MQVEMKIEDGALVIDPPKKKIDWNLYRVFATVEATQKMSMGSQSIYRGALDATETLEVRVYRVPDTVGGGHIWIDTLNVKGFDDKQIIEFVRKRIEEYEEEENDGRD